ncbi:hypothetical protein CASFOL_008911 [Castilleja foliolosa]|uniref:Peptidase A1 domain-containing protein n=1 Tax=Castilleja foliolosa TaxID=1961234 RepID=A0ABD3E0L5_9LAMI
MNYGARSSGYLARETFTFASSNGDNKTEQVKDTVFGCGIQNKGFTESAKDNLMAGNFGLGPGVFSFLRQKRSLTQGRFSYCFLPWDTAHKSPVFLRFGSDIPEREGLKSTPLLEHSGSTFHFVNLAGISVGNTRLDIPREMLAGSDRRDSGCIVDSGYSVTTLPSAIYKKLRETLIKNHFSRYKSKMFTRFKLYYYFSSKNETIDDLPVITFHLQDSDLVFPPRLGFITDKCLGKRYFCLAMDLDTDDMTVIGAFQQIALVMLRMATLMEYPVFLRFGSDIPKRKDLKSTPLLTKPGASDHFVNLLGISVGNPRLDIPQKMFGQSSKRNSGCIVDSGSYMTRLPRTVYNKLTETLMTNHFSGNERLRLGSDLVFPPRQGFIDLDAGNGDSLFCLAIMPYDIEGERVIVIGGFQQANMRFVFDTVKQKLYFGPEDCSRDG